jgi:hypothetical protein
LKWLCWDPGSRSHFKLELRHPTHTVPPKSGLRRNRWPSLPRSTRAFRPHARVRQRSLARQGASASWPNRATVPAAQRLRRGRRLRSFRHSLSTVRRERCALCNECFRRPVHQFRRNREEHLDFLAGHHVLATDEVHSALGKIHCLAFYHAKAHCGVGRGVPVLHYSKPYRDQTFFSWGYAAFMAGPGSSPVPTVKRVDCWKGLLRIASKQGGVDNFNIFTRPWS